MAHGACRSVWFVALVMLSCSATAQPGGQAPRMGLLSPDPIPGERDTLILRRLSELGWQEGRNLVIERRSAENKAERLPALALELARMKVNLIVAMTTPGVDAARKATTTIPIVMAPAGDALGSGFVTNLGRPGGNITGVTFTHESIGQKRLELLKDMSPTLTRVAVLGEQQTRLLHEPLWRAADAAAKTLKLSARFFEVHTAAEIEDVFAAMALARVEGVVVLPSALFARERHRIAELAIRNRMLSMCDRAEYVEAGCLMSYGANLAAILERAATQIDRVLKGAKPADIPVEQPTRFELTINAKSAKALGITPSPLVMVRAERVIE